MNTCKKEIFDIYSAFIFFFKFYIKHVFYVSKTLRKLGEVILQLIMQIKNMVLNLQQLFIPFLNKSDEKLFAIKKNRV